MQFAYLMSAFLGTGTMLYLLKPIAPRIGLIDIPGGRKTHLTATPLVGGLGVFFGLVAGTTLMPGLLAEFAPLLSLAALVLFMGTIDDAKELTPFVRMTGHSLIALAMAVVAEVQLHTLGNLLGFGNVGLGAVAIPVTVFAAVGVINAINMSDGVDGLSGGLVITSLAFIGYLAWSSGDLLTAKFCAVAASSIVAFLTLNFRRPWQKRALVYLGDAGSTMLGFMLAWLLINLSQGSSGSAPLFSPVYALWFISVPLFDTVNLLIKRPLRGASPFTPGHDHLHHNLLKRGWRVEHVVALLVSASFLMGLTGLIGLRFGADEYVMFCLFLSLFALYFVYSDKIQVNDQ